MLNIKQLPPSSDWILDDTNKFLSMKCKKVVFPLDKKDELLVNKMINYIDACYEGKDEELNIRPGIAVAAPQIGCDKQIIYIHFNDGKEHKLLLANPEIIAHSVAYSYLKQGEGCLSVNKEVEGHVKRHNIIKVRALDMLDNNKEVVITADGLLSICLQHEIDHLSGIVFYQRIDKKNRFLDDDQTLIAY